MKLTHLTIENFLGARAVDLDLGAAAIHLIAGANGAGKSSIQEAVRLALTGESVRVALKKDYPALVSTGAERGFVEVTTQDCLAAVTTLPDGKRIGHAGADLPALPYVLAAQRFAGLPVDERRAFLFGLMGLSTDGPAVRQRLADAGCDAKRVEAIAPLLRAGFAAAADDAKGRARDAKSAWRTITGETYGAKKAEGWAAAKPAPAGDAEALQAQLDDLDAKLAGHNRELGAMQAQAAARAAAVAEAAALREKAGRHARIAEKLKIDQAELVEWEAKVAATAARAGTGPRVGVEYDLARAADRLLAYAPSDCDDRDFAEAALQAYERLNGKINAQGDPEAAAALPEYTRARDLLARAVENGKRDLAEADAAANQLAALALDEPADDGKQSMLEDLVAELQTRKSPLRQQLQAARDSAAQAARADEQTKRAAAAHVDVAAWDQIADLMSPGGIPAELSAEALGPLNRRLAQSADLAEWAAVAVGTDMQITAGGRAYDLLSESEQWRADAMLAEAVSHLSGLGLLVLDRFDVLDLRGRGDLIAWLEAVAEQGELQTALVFGTLKAPPLPQSQLIAVHWVENGVVGGLRAAA